MYKYYVLTSIHFDNILYKNKINKLYNTVVKKVILSTIEKFIQSHFSRYAFALLRVILYADFSARKVLQISNHL